MKLYWCDHTIDGQTVRVWQDGWCPDVVELMPRKDLELLKCLLDKYQRIFRDILRIEIEEYSEHDE